MSSCASRPGWAGFAAMGLHVYHATFCCAMAEGDYIFDTVVPMIVVRNQRAAACSIAGALLCGLLSSEAFALQPLETFLKAARTANYDNRESAASTKQRSAE